MCDFGGSLASFESKGVTLVGRLLVTNYENSGLRAFDIESGLPRRFVASKPIQAQRCLEIGDIDGDGLRDLAIVGNNPLTEVKILSGATGARLCELDCARLSWTLPQIFSQVSTICGSGPASTGHCRDVAVCFNSGWLAVFAGTDGALRSKSTKSVLPSEHWIPRHICEVATADDSSRLLVIAAWSAAPLTGALIGIDPQSLEAHAIELDSALPSQCVGEVQTQLSATELLTCGWNQSACYRIAIVRARKGDQFLAVLSPGPR
jgi:hypothetical protein